MKDHEIAKLVNDLRDIAMQYIGAQQLRERIAARLAPAIEYMNALAAEKDKRIAELERQAIYEFGEDGIPTFRYTDAPHELEELVTPERCKMLVDHFLRVKDERDALRTELADVKAELSETEQVCGGFCKRALTAEAELAKLKDQKPVAIKTPAYHGQAMGCGLEDRGITDRYEAMLYGWECAIEKMWEAIGDSELYARPVHPIATLEAVREACRNICEGISDAYREREARKYPELKTDAETGAADCESAIRAIDLSQFATQAPAVNYFDLQEFADKHGVPYNELCATVRKAMLAALPASEPPVVPPKHNQKIACLIEAARCLGVAQQANDVDAVVHWNAKLEALRTAAIEKAPSSEAMRQMIEGMTVSVDVSTGEYDATHRYFGTVTEVMECSGDKHGVTLLVQDAQPNFEKKAPASEVKDAELLDFISHEYLKVDPFEMPTGQGDADVGWRLSQYHMGRPSEVVLYEHYRDDLRGAIRAAMAQQKGGVTLLVQDAQPNFEKKAPAGGVKDVANLPFAILDDELVDLRRFHECVTDGEVYDVPKERMKRLAEIGLVRRVTANYYEHTVFGLSVLNGYFDASMAQQGEPQ